MVSVIYIGTKIRGYSMKHKLKAYKLVKKRKDGTLGPLFINKKQRMPIGEWMAAEDHPTKGYAHRMGWHCTLRKQAPHLSEKGRVWCEVEVSDWKHIERPLSQGGMWVLANNMKIVKECV